MDEPQPTIMIVDDTPENLELLAEVLGAKEYRVMQFPGGELALRAALKSPPDLILLDIMMPRMDGFEVCHRLKATEALREIPVIFLSALDSTSDKVRAFTEGGVDYVTKPFREEEVLARVAVHLELRRQKQEIKKLLNETLVGAVKALNELLAVSCPRAYRKTLKIAQHVHLFASRAGLKNPWMFTAAANLSNLGRIFSDCEVPFSKESSRGEKGIPRSSPQGIFKEASEIVRKIPRLELVGDMIEKVGEPFPTEDWWDWPLDVLGGQLLTLATAFESSLEKGFPEKEALLQMEREASRQGFHLGLLRDFGRAVCHFDLAANNGTGEWESGGPEKKREEWIETPMALRPGQYLVEDLLTDSGELLLSKGTYLTPNLCSLVKKRSKVSPLSFPLKVFVKE
ncbi:MAG TPA: response regulator [Thermotogota bacterium]|nr:response regulator [Thermotogota bacterium]